MDLGRTLQALLIGSAALLAALAAVVAVRGEFCAGAPFSPNPTLLFCPDQVPRMVAAEVEHQAARALQDGDTAEVEAALTRDLNPEAAQRLMPLAVRSGSVGAVQRLIDAGARVGAVPSPARRFDTWPEPAANVAARQGDIHMLEFLLSRGADIDGVVLDGARRTVARTSPLGEAARHGDIEMATFLLARGADANGGLSALALKEARLRRLSGIEVGFWYDQYVTPVYQALYCLAHQNHYWPKVESERCRRIGVMLVERGAVLFGGESVEDVIKNLRGEAREKAASLLLAMAAREGRWEAMLAVMEVRTDPLWLRKGATAPNPHADFKPYLARVRACGPARMRSMRDHFAFC